MRDSGARAASQLKPGISHRMDLGFLGYRLKRISPAFLSHVVPGASPRDRGITASLGAVAFLRDQPYYGGDHNPRNLSGPYKMRLSRRYLD